jgi:pimeloyl-ACP methyl ester carboxylesterase
VRRTRGGIAYFTGGTGDSLLLLLHGLGATAAVWRRLLPLVEESWEGRWAAPDLRGHGLSTMDGRFRFDDAVTDILALLDELGLHAAAGAPVVLVGLSLGGNIAQEIVHREPGRATALVVADSTCNTAPRHPLAAPMTIASLTAMTLGGRAKFMRQAAEATSPNDDVRQYVLEANDDRTTGEVVQILASLLEHALHPEPDYRLPVPTLLLHGDADRIGDIVDGTRDWAARDEHAEYVVVPDAGHASNQDNPEAFIAALSEFLGRVLPRRRARWAA